MPKKILFALISIFLAYRSVELVKTFLALAPEQLSWVEVTILAFLFNLFVTGVFAFIGFEFPSSRLLPDAYYFVKHPKQLKKMHTLLGVKYFRSFLLVTFWGKEKNRKKYFNGTKSGIQQFAFQTRQSEFGHLGAFIALTTIAFILASRGHVLAFTLTASINIIINFYPIVLQRVHRINIQRITNKTKSE